MKVKTEKTGRIMCDSAVLIDWMNESERNSGFMDKLNCLLDEHDTSIFVPIEIILEISGDLSRADIDRVRSFLSRINRVSVIRDIFLRLPSSRFIGGIQDLVAIECYYACMKGRCYLPSEDHCEFSSGIGGRTVLRNFLRKANDELHRSEMRGIREIQKVKGNVLSQLWHNNRLIQFRRGMRVSDEELNSYKDFKSVEDHALAGLKRFPDEEGFEELRSAFREYGCDDNDIVTANLMMERNPDWTLARSICGDNARIVEIMRLIGIMRVAESRLLSLDYEKVAAKHVGEDGVIGVFRPGVSLREGFLINLRDTPLPASDISDLMQCFGQKQSSAVASDVNDTNLLGFGYYCDAMTADKRTTNSVNQAFQAIKKSANEVMYRGIVDGFNGKVIKNSEASPEKIEDFFKLVYS